jgi:hypothetical protein
MSQIDAFGLSFLECSIQRQSLFMKAKGLLTAAEISEQGSDVREGFSFAIHIVNRPADRQEFLVAGECFFPEFEIGVSPGGLVEQLRDSRLISG